MSLNEELEETVTADIGSFESCLAIEMVATTRMGTVSGFLRFAAAAETGAEPIFKLSLAIDVQIGMRRGWTWWWWLDARR